MRVRIVIVKARPHAWERPLHARRFRSMTHSGEQDVNFLWIGLGSALGGMARYGCSGRTARREPPEQPPAAAYRLRIDSCRIRRPNYRLARESR